MENDESNLSLVYISWSQVERLEVDFTTNIVEFINCLAYDLQFSWVES